MKRLFAILPLLLLGCSHTTSVNSQANTLSRADDKQDISPKIMSNSYILAEPLPNKKVKISITAKDKDLYIANCNNVIAPALVEKDSEKIVWGGVSDACKSPDIVIKKGTSYEFIETIHDKDASLSLNKYYQVRILPLNDSWENPHATLPNSAKTSQVFKLLP